MVYNINVTVSAHRANPKSLYESLVDLIVVIVDFIHTIIERESH